MPLIKKGQHLSRNTEFKVGNNSWDFKKRLSVKDRILPRIKKCDNGCWEWTGGYSSNGYGAIKINEKQIGVHRVAYELFKGPISVGLTIDHLCKNKKCVNPDHLEAVTLGVNVLRGDNPAALNARKTHCRRGHKFDENNTYINPCNNQRVCRICNIEYQRGWRKSHAHNK